MGGRGQPQLHHRDQAVPAPERPCLLAELSKQRHCFVQGLRAMIFEGSRYHGILPGARHRAGAILQVFVDEKETFRISIDRNWNPDQHHGAQTPPRAPTRGSSTSTRGAGPVYAEGGDTTCSSAAAIASKRRSAPCSPISMRPTGASPAR